MRNIYLTLTWRQAKTLYESLDVFQQMGSILPAFRKTDASVDLDFVRRKLQEEMER